MILNINQKEGIPSFLNISYMKTIFLITIIALLTQIGYSQAFKNDVKKYYKNVYLAEEAILDSNYNEALNYYNEAFVCNTPFLRDIKNARKLCELTNNISQMTEYNKIINGITNNTAMTISYCLLNRDTCIDVEFFHKIIVDAVVEKDQNIRDSCSNISFDLYNNPSCAAAIKKVDFANANILEYLIIDIIKSGKRGVTNSVENALWLVAIHNFSWKNYNLFKGLLILCEIGLFDARELGSLIDDIRNNNKKYEELPAPFCNKYYMNHLFIINNSLFVENLDSATTHKVDSIRTDLCLCSYELQSRKTIFQFFDTSFRFVNNLILTMSKDEYNYFFEKYSTHPEKDYSIYTKQDDK